MIELVIYACIFSGECKEYKVKYYDMTQHQCALHSQMLLARWSNDHPNWKIKNYACSAEHSTINKSKEKQGI